MSNDLCAARLIIGAVRFIMTVIKHIIEPERLLLVWQEPLSRHRFIVGEIVREKAGVCFRYLLGDELDQAKTNGFKGYLAFRDLSGEYRLGVMESFMSRLPPRSREDFGKFLDYWKIDPDAEISDFSLLGYTGAILPRDGFRLLPLFPRNVSQVNLIIELAGYRYHEHTAELGETVSFVHESENPEDEYAVAVYADMEPEARRIGYVMRGLNQQFIAWMMEGHLQGRIVRINGTKERLVILILAEFSCAVRQSSYS